MEDLRNEDELDGVFVDQRYTTTIDTIQALRNTSVSPEAAIGLRVYQGLMHTLWMRRIREELQLVYTQTLDSLQLRMHDVAIMIGDEASEFEDVELEALMQALSDSLEEEQEEELNSPEAIELVAPVAQVSDTDLSDKCSICIDDIERLQLWRKLDCSHVFHKKCIDTWFQRKLSCPLCRVSLVHSIK